MAGERRLRLALSVSLLLALVEAAGGLLGGSLAVLSDALHLLLVSLPPPPPSSPVQDAAGLGLALLAAVCARSPPSPAYPFGLVRAEVLGALLSLLSLWVFAAALFCEAAARFLRWLRGESVPVDGRLMLLLGSLAVAVNLLLGLLLAGDPTHPLPAHLPHGHPHYGSCAGHRLVSAELCAECGPEARPSEAADANLRAAALHVVADLAQAVLVAVCGLLVWRWPGLAVLDPVCSLVFSPLVVAATLPPLREVLRVLLEGTPEHVWVVSRSPPSSALDRHAGADAGAESGPRSRRGEPAARLESVLDPLGRHLPPSRRCRTRPVSDSLPVGH